MTTDLPDLPEIPDHAYIERPDQLPALDSPIRMRILKASLEPSSVREIADALDMPVTRLYHHINLLHDAGFLDVVHTRKSGARIEKLYRIAGKSITPSPNLVDNIDDPQAAARAMVSIVLGPTQVEAEAALTARFAGKAERVDLGRTSARLTPAAARALGERIEALVREVMEGKQHSDDPEALEYSFTFALLPVQVD